MQPGDTGHTHVEEYRNSMMTCSQNFFASSFVNPSWHQATEATAFPSP
jgi:hypothetical protein